MPQRSPASSSLATLSEVPGTELRQLQASFESFREFVARYSPWLSDSCIFVETLETVPVGAPVRLEIWLRDRPLLIWALGQVDWVRVAPDDEGPPGVALNITYLDPASARLIDSIFRLYTGQQSAAMGKEVVETWELDVESLIDQAFPGAPEPAPTSAAPSQAEVASPEVASPEVAPPAEVSQETASPEAAPSEAASSGADSLDWTLPEGVVVVAPSDATPPDVTPAAPTPPEVAFQDSDSLDWTLPEGVIVAQPDPLPEAHDGFELPNNLAEMPDEPDVPIELEEIEVPELATPSAPAMPVLEPESPAVPLAPLESPASLEPPTSLEPPASFEPPAWASASTSSDAALPDVDAAVPMAASEPEDAEWEARLSSAFSEHDAADPAATQLVQLDLPPEGTPRDGAASRNGRC